MLLSVKEYRIQTTSQKWLILSSSLFIFFPSRILTVFQLVRESYANNLLRWCFTAREKQKSINQRDFLRKLCKISIPTNSQPILSRSLKHSQILIFRQYVPIISIIGHLSEYWYFNSRSDNIDHMISYPTNTIEVFMCSRIQPKFYIHWMHTTTADHHR